MPLRTGLSAQQEHLVTDDDTAVAVGSGSLRVLGTPRLVAWWEAATCAAVDQELDAGSTTVGTRVAVEHLAASVVGATVQVQADLVHVDGRLLRFSVAAHQDQKLVGSGEVTRVVVDAETFLSRLSRG